MIGATVQLNDIANIATISGSVGATLTLIFVPLFRRGLRQWHEGLNETIDNRVTPHFTEIMSEIMNTQDEVKKIREKVISLESRLSYLEGINRGKEVS